MSAVAMLAPCKVDQNTIPGPPGHPMIKKETIDSPPATVSKGKQGMLGWGGGN